MFKLFVTLMRGKNADAAESLADATALPVLRQQLRDCAAAIETARRSVAMVMAYETCEKATAARIARQLADLETRALDALAKGRDDLATEAAGAIAQLEAEATTTARALATYQTEIAQLRVVVAKSESRLRDLQRGHHLAFATNQTQKLRAPVASTATLDDAEATLSRLQQGQAKTEATRAALFELSAAGSADAMRDRLAAAGCGAPLRPDAVSVLDRLRAKSA